MWRSPSWNTLTTSTTSRSDVGCLPRSAPPNAPRPRPAPRPASGIFLSRSSEKILKPELYALRDLLDSASGDRQSPSPGARATERQSVRPILRETNHGREPRRLHRVAQARDVLQRHSYA